MTIAPTGTIATVAGCEGYGCEPVFALAYKRHVNDKGQDLVLNYMSPLFERALQDYGLTQAEIDQICKEVAETGSCQHVVGVPPAIKNVFVCSSDISPIEHVKMQAALQTAIDNSISKTINMPETATVQDVKNVYYTAWHMGCKGLTVYVTGSREKVVLETNKTSTSKVEPELTASDEKITRPEILTGKTIKLDTPLGTIFVTVNEDQYGPFEAFLVSAKAGSETTAISEAIGRLISLVLRMNSSISRRSRLQEIVRQLRGIGGSNHVGFGPRKVKSLPDGIAIALEKYLDDPAVQQLAETLPSKKLDVNICPECGDASLVLEEGCEKCRNCGYSKC
jgi:ribonucleoside-diphosphate reductase alpha chain